MAKKGFPLEWCQIEVAKALACSAVSENLPTVLHKGGCHCGAVRFEVMAPEEVILVLIVTL
jgi:hypothetical protein